MAAIVQYVSVDNESDDIIRSLIIHPTNSTAQNKVCAAD
jgi:hypothetical protein